MLKDVLSGAPAAVMPLIEDVHHAEWRATLDAMRQGQADGFVRRVFEQFGPRAFTELLRNAVMQQGVSGPEGRVFRLEVYESLQQAAMRLYGAEDERTLAVHVFLVEQTWTSYENPVAAVSAVFKRVEKHAPALMAQVALILGHAYLVERVYDRALEAYRTAVKVAAHRPAAERRMVACLLYLGRFREARELSIEVLKSRGALLGSSDVLGAAPSRVERAVDELRSILDWCTTTSAEWVRGLGVLAWELRQAGRPSAEVETWFEASLGATPELDVVQRQALERGAMWVAYKVSQKVVEHADPTTVAGQWTRFNHGVLLAETGDFDAAFELQRDAAGALESLSPQDGERAFLSHARMLASQERADAALDALGHVQDTQLQAIAAQTRDRALLLKGDGDARARLLAHMNRLHGAQQLATPEGEDLVGVLVGDAIGRGDRSAVELQRTFMGAVHERFGHGPPVWMERINLAGVHAQLGDLLEAERILRDVIRDQEAQFGANYADLLRTRGMLAQLLDQKGDAAGAKEQRDAIAAAGTPVAWEEVRF